MKKKVKDEQNKKNMKNMIRNMCGVLGFTALSCIIVLLVLIIGKSFANPLEDDVEVKERTELVYYLTVSYDGVDKYGWSSSDKYTASINSGTLFINDKIPDGLVFTGFVTTSDGTIGAVTRSNKTACPGKVVDDTNEENVDDGIWNNDNTEYTYHGLHYNEDTRTVSFQVKDLQAGCELTVGIKTKTPLIDDATTIEREIRRDFYNFATIRERGLTIESNTVHAFMGNENAFLYDVDYEYTGEVPDGAPNPPKRSSYPSGTKVGVASDVEVEGYEFSGWNTTDTTINNRSFSMPEGDVVLRGNFNESTANTVHYKLSGPTPDGYILPTDKEYYPDTVVKVDSLKVGDIFNGYRFLGWETIDVTLNNDGEFIMPSSNVTITGRFEEYSSSDEPKEKYKVIYQFYDDVLPPNADDYIPETKEYEPGETVTIEDISTDISGYRFLGWYQDKEFKMPDYDITVYGEWIIQAGTFEPTITNEIIDKKEYYKKGEDVKYKIVITNTASFPIKNIIVKE